MNRKILTRNSPIVFDDTELEHFGRSPVVGEDIKHIDTASNYPDVVSCTSSQSQESIDDSKDPDVVRSNSSDEKSIDYQGASKKAKNPPKSSGTVHSSVSSFSSSDDSKQSTSSYPDSDRKPKTSTVPSNSSVDNDDLQQQAFLAREDGSTKFLFNGDSVFSQESEDVFDPPQPFRQLQLSDNVPTIIRSNYSPSKMESNSNNSCSEQGQKARNRFSSSGYCTGSGESAQGNSASKSSVQLSQEGDNTIPPQGTQTYKSIKEELTYAVDGAFNPDMKNLAPKTMISMYQNQKCDNLGDNSLVTKGVKTHFDLSPLSQENTNEPFLKPHINKCVQQQGPQTHDVPTNTGSPQDKKQSQESPQKVVQHQTTVIDGAKPQHPQAPPQLHNSSTYLAINGRSIIGYADSPQQIWQLPLHLHLTLSGSLNHNLTHSSSFSRESCFVPQSVEDKWTAEQSDASLARLLLLQSGPGPSESSGETQYHLESLIQKDNQGIRSQIDNTESTAQKVHSFIAQCIPNFDGLLSDSMVSLELSSVMISSLGDQVGKDVWEKLKKSMRCTEADCNVPDCAQIKMDIAALHSGRNHVWSLSEDQKMLLLTMFNHMVYYCDHPKCPFPWCGEHEDNCDQLSQEQCLMMMKQRVENFAEQFVLSSFPVKYMKMKATLSSDQMPVEGQDWVRLCMMGNSRRALLAQPIKSDLSNFHSGNEYWVLKKVSTADDGDLWGLYSRLREVNHRSVVTFLWVAGFDEHIIVCSLYEGFSLYECLPSLPSQQFRFTTIFSIMQQLMSAVRHLNSLGIVFLYWISKNIQVTYYTGQDFVVKLSNFSCSVLLKPPDGKPPCYDGGHLLLALPRHIIPPELKDNITVEFVSDIWGLACLLHELVTGHPVWHEYRHVSDKYFRSIKEVKPYPPSIYPELIEVFTASWETNTSARAELSDLEIMWIHAYQVHLMS